MQTISSQIVDLKQNVLSTVTATVTSDALTNSLGKNAYYICVSMNSATRSLFQQTDTTMGIDYYGFQKIGVVGSLVDNSQTMAPIPVSQFGLIFGAVFGSLAGCVFLSVFIIIIVIIIVELVQRKKKSENFPREL
jgi:hypothetical protein